MKKINLKSQKNKTNILKTNNNTLQVDDMNITIFNKNDNDYFCLTNIVNDPDKIKNWIRTLNTITFLEAWESIHNKNFKPVGIDRFKKEATSKNFKMSPQKWVKATNAIGILSKSGRYGGTYAHKDIALEFATWLSPTFKLFLLKDYQRLKNLETNEYTLEWKFKRSISKTNYKLHTDSIKTNIVDKLNNNALNSRFEYITEADILNNIVWGTSAKNWRLKYPELASQGKNIRDNASINELKILSNLEFLNAQMIDENIDRNSRIKILTKSAQMQFESFKNYDHLKDLKKLQLQNKLEELN